MQGGEVGFGKGNHCLQKKWINKKAQAYKPPVCLPQEDTPGWPSLTSETCQASNLLIYVTEWFKSNYSSFDLI